MGIEGSGTTVNLEGKGFKLKFRVPVLNGEILVQSTESSEEERKKEVSLVNTEDEKGKENGVKDKKDENTEKDKKDKKVDKTENGNMSQQSALQVEESEHARGKP